MKYLALFTALIFHLNGWSQHIYGSISGGHQFVVNNEQTPSFMVNTFHQISQPWFLRKENVAFNRVTNFDLSFGYQFKKNIGFEITGSFLKPARYVTSENAIARELSGIFFRINPRFIIGVNLNKIQLYSKLGFIIGCGKITYSQYFMNNTLEYEYCGGTSYGFNGYIGISVPINKRLAFFAELQAVSQSFSPKRGKTLVNINDGEDQLANYEFSSYDTQIEFSSTEEMYLSPPDAYRPQKLYKRNFSLSGYGITIGMKFILWNGEKGEEIGVEEK